MKLQLLYYIIDAITYASRMEKQRLEKQRDQGKKAIWDRGNNQFKGTEFEVIAYGKWTFSNATED